jgi:50S ribosomal protein L16 3-hydroxylase
MVSVETVQGPLTPSLLASNWGRKPLLIQSAFDINEPSWPEWEEVVEFACDDDAESRLIQHVPGDLTSFTLSVGPFESSFLERISTKKKKWTLVVNDVERFHPPLSDWMDDMFAFIPGWRRDDGQVSLAPVGGGIGPHVDNYDVFLIQTSGQRCWEVGKEQLTVAEERELLINGIDVRILSEWDHDSYDRLVLNPGDVLYLPPRVPHSGISLSDRCTTLSVGCRAPSASELISRVAQQMTESVRESAVRRYQDFELFSSLPENYRYRRDVNASWTRGDLTAQVKQQMKELALNAIHDIMNDDELWDQLIGEIVTQPNRPRDAYPVPLDEVEESGIWGNSHTAVQSVLSGNGVLFRAEGMSFAYSTLAVDDQVHYRVFANGNLFQVVSAPDAELQSLVASIVDEPCLTERIFSTCGQNVLEKVVPLFERLVSEGLLYGTDEE